MGSHEDQSFGLYEPACNFMNNFIICCNDTMQERFLAKTVIHK